MKETNRNRVIVLAITEGGLTASEAATRYAVSKRWIYTLLARYRTRGLDAVDPQPCTESVSRHRDGQPHLASPL